MRTALCLVVALAVSVPARAGVADANDLKQIGLAYHTYYGNHFKPPGTLQNLAPFLGKNEKLLNLLKNEDVILFYNTNLTELPAGQSQTVLAYNKDVPAKGGWVVMADGRSVKKMSAADFMKAAKGGKVKEK
jgi:hypothetical protein